MSTLRALKTTPTGWKVLLCASIALSAVLRTVWIEDMEWKSDEQYMYDSATAGGWTWLGMPSGVHVRNPGMSIWIFQVLARVFSVTSPPDLSAAVGILNTLALALLAVFALRWIKKPAEREPWLWSIALIAVNPIAVQLQRKIWAQSVLPFFSVLFLMAFWSRRGRMGALTWGLMGAVLGQIHMSGFFFSAGMLLWVLAFEKGSVHKRASWKYWLAGSILGALPLLPWLAYFLSKESGSPTQFSWDQPFQLRYFVFWLSDPLGFHLGHPLGLHLGEGVFTQNSRFFEYPLWDDKPTYGVAAANVIAALVGARALASAYRALRRNKWALKSTLTGRESETAFAQSAAGLGYGGLITASTVLVRRYYLIVTFPLQWVWLSRLSLSDPRPAAQRRGRAALALLWLAHLFISIQFLRFVHTNGGSEKGDYGTSYRSQVHRLELQK
jgi:hypothetical protein